MSVPGLILAAGPAPGANSALWYLDRGTGVVCLLLLTGVVAAGVLVRRGGTVAGLPRFVVAGLHRNLSLLTLALLAVHVTTSVVDPYAPIRLADAAVPLVSDYRPLWLGLGAGALDLLLAVVVTSLLRLRIGRTAWRAVHWSTFAAWPVALVHGLGTGSDIRSVWMLVLCAGSLTVVLVAVLWRIGAAHDVDRRWRTALGVLTIAAPAVLTGWLVLGPLAPGWAARSGTPQALVAHTAPGSGSARPVGSAGVSGSVSEQPVGPQTLAMSLSGTLTGGPGGTLRLVLTGTSTGADGQVLATSGTAELNPAGGGRYTGTLSRFDGDRFEATLSGPAGQAMLVTSVTIDLSAGSFTGTVVIS